MYRIKIQDEKNRYELTELARMFLPADELKFSAEDGSFGDVQDGETLSGCFVVPGPEQMDRGAQKRALYEWLSEETGLKPDWGTLTGVRPLKLFRKLGGGEKAAEILQREYLVSPEKTELLLKTWETQQAMSFDRSGKAAGLYVGIPFCPTRCLYCSFTSNRFEQTAAEKYMLALKKEIEATAEIMQQKGLYAESIYIGGGTPTALPDDMFAEMVETVGDAFLRPETVEFTVECGRPDTINEYKLKALRKAGCGRISINPQTMKPKTLELIGRKHSPEQIVEAYRLARSCGIGIINMDLIAGLPEETASDLEDTLRIILDLSPENITVHTLAVKRGSRLIEAYKDYSYSQGKVVREMLGAASFMLKDAGYAPYYLYRQKQMAGNFENVGYCLPGTASIYNVRIMEEDQSILALGAGGVSKVYYSEEDRLERVANVSNYEIYIDRIDEMIERKEKGL